MFINYLSKFYGVNYLDLKKFLFLGSIFAFTIGIYWMLSPLRDSIFCTMCSVLNIPVVKWLSLIVSVPIAMAYSMIVDRYPRHQVFYILCTIYTCLALIFAYFLAHQTYGIDQNNIVKTIVDGQVITCHTQVISRLLAWALYLYVESFGALMVILFWGFAADTTKPETASSGFSFIAMGAQIGGIVGPLMIALFVKSAGEAVLMLLVAIAIICLAGLIYLFMLNVPAEQLEGYQAKEYQAKKTKGSEVKTGFMHGLMLLLREPYLLGIFLIIAICEVISTVLDYKLRLVAQSIYIGRELTHCFSSFGMWVNIIGFLCLVLGVNKIGLRLGVKGSLLILPVLAGLAVFLVYFNNSLNVLWVVNVALRAFNYAFNQPVKEQLYIPTSKDTKYKAKAWIEMFGSRGAKAFGSSINFILKFFSQQTFLLISMVSSLGLVAIWMWAAVYVGRKYQIAVDSKKTVF